MATHLTITVAGAFILDNESNIINTRPFEIKPLQAASALIAIENETLPKELEQMLKEHKEETFVIQNTYLAQLVSSKGFAVEVDYDNPIISSFHKNITNSFLNMGLFKTEREYYQFLRETSIFLTKERVKKSADKRDKLVVHAIETIDDLDKTLNLFSNRLREFYGMHFPELVDAIENHYTFAIIVSKTGDKSKITEQLLVEDLNLPKEKAQKLLESRERTMGSDLKQEDLTLIKEQAAIVVEMFERRHSMEKWMEATMQEIAPNISGVISPLLGARLIALAGSLKDLATSPSSKIQVLGAEKALYRTLKTGAPPPKHGVIYQDPRLNQSKWWHRGKIARVLAGRISIASRMDYFEADDKSSELSAEVNEKIDEIIEKYPDPPKRQKRKGGSSSRKKSSKKKSNYKKKRRHN